MSLYFSVNIIFFPLDKESQTDGEAFSGRRNLLLDHKVKHLFSWKKSILKGVRNKGGKKGGYSHITTRWAA